jgi:ferredoxin-NADP reductase
VSILVQTLLLASCKAKCPYLARLTSKKWVLILGRQLFTARLDRKLCLSESAQCFHLEYVVDELEGFPFSPGQFVSSVAEDCNGKQQTRAYSLASSANGNRFDLCINRVEGGFFSNYLCDMEPEQTMKFHGPHGLFVLRQPLTDSIFVATGTGIAPMRGFAQWLFPGDGKDRSEGKEFWVVYGTRYETEIYYREYFEELAATYKNFHYICSLSRAGDEWTGKRGYVQEYVAKIVQERATNRPPLPVVQPGEVPVFDAHTYICGLNNMVSATRDRLVELGWHKKQVVFERYD